LIGLGVINKKVMNKKARFAGKTAVVSGAASGIGKAVAARLAAEGAQVVVADVNAEAGKKVAAEIGPVAEFSVLNVVDPDSWRQLVAGTRAREGVDVLVNAAGILKAIDLENDPLADFTRVLDVNVTGTMLGCQAVTPKMRGRDDASIVNMGSVSAYIGTWNLIAYDVSKGAVRNLTKELAVYYARRGDRIRCNAVHPGVVQTGMVDGFFAENADEREAWVATQPNGKFARPEEIANLIVYLASSDARFMTGGDYVVDGGSLK
jgi:NAD(P)-dependent dehydrogenase (short-subunit alcohol dehydrogenase family)